MSLENFVKLLPKVELHLHLEGAVAAATFGDLAAQNGIDLPGGKAAAALYDYSSLVDFLKIYDLVCASIRTAADFSRVTFEALERCAAGGARYVEFFFSPHAHLKHGVSYETMLEGILAGMRKAEVELALHSRLIPAHSRELGPEAGELFLDMVLAERLPEVIGIGLDYNELPFPPAPFAALYQRAREAGLKVTAHAGETGPSSYVADSIDLLGVRRIDHGYHVVDDAALMERCRRDGIVFTCCPSTTLGTTVWTDLAAPDHAIRQMIEAGLTVTINSDDPPMFGTTLDREYLLVATHFGLSLGDLKRLALAGLNAAWLDDFTRQTWISAWSREIDLLTETELASAA